MGRFVGVGVGVDVDVCVCVCGCMCGGGVCMFRGNHTFVHTFL